MRYFDTDELFGKEGYTVDGPCTCEWCGVAYNYYTHDSVPVTLFAEKHVCHCCYEKIENEILRRIGVIIPWYREVLKQQCSRIIKNIDLLQTIPDVVPKDSPIRKFIIDPEAS